MITNFYPNNGITTLFQNLEKIIVFNICIYLFLMILTQMLSLSMKILHPSLITEVLLTSSFLLIFRLLGLHTSSVLSKETFSFIRPYIWLINKFLLRLYYLFL